MNITTENLQTDTVEIWKKITSHLQLILSDAGYKTFLSSATPTAFDENVLTVQVPNEFSKEWIKEKCEPEINSGLADTIFENLLINYVVLPSKIEEVDSTQLSIFGTRHEDDLPEKTTLQTAFNPQYNFDNFIVGHNNR
ncbi:MAG: chromosomal replication initiator protein, partial [Candidatus Marinamargulisbacteria bacterium]